MIGLNKQGQWAWLCPAVQGRSEPCCDHESKSGGAHYDDPIGGIGGSAKGFYRRWWDTTSTYIITFCTPMIVRHLWFFGLICGDTIFLL